MGRLEFQLHWNIILKVVLEKHSPTQSVRENGIEHLLMLLYLVLDVFKIQYQGENIENATNRANLQGLTNRYN